MIHKQVRVRSINVNPNQPVLFGIENLSVLDQSSIDNFPNTKTPATEKIDNMKAEKELASTARVVLPIAYKQNPPITSPKVSATT